MGNSKSWINKANRIVQDFNLGIIDNYVIITTYSAASSLHFKRYLINLKAHLCLLQTNVTISHIKDLMIFPSIALQLLWVYLLLQTGGGMKRELDI